MTPPTPTRATTSITTAALVLAGSAAVARRARVSASEARWFHTVNSAPDRWFAPVWALMQAGSLGATPVVAGIAGAGGRRRGGLAVLGAGVGAWTAAKMVKPLVRRGRPAEYLAGVVVRGRPQRGLGYPSGHAAVATALAISATPAGSTRTIAIGTAALIGASRMYVGAHLPLDLVGGVALGTLAGTTVNSLLRD